MFASRTFRRILPNSRRRLTIASISNNPMPPNKPNPEFTPEELEALKKLYNFIKYPVVLGSVYGSVWAAKREFDQSIEYKYSRESTVACTMFGGWIGALAGAFCGALWPISLGVLAAREICVSKSYMKNMQN